MSVLLVLTSVQVQIIVIILKETMNVNVHMAMSYLQKILIDVKVYKFTDLIIKLNYCNYNVLLNF